MMCGYDFVGLNLFAEIVLKAVDTIGTYSK